MFWKRNAPPKRSPHLKATEAGGHAFYHWPEAGALPTKRALAYMAAAYENTLRVSEADINVFAKLMREAINEGNLSRCGFLVETLTAYRSLYATEQNLFRLGNCFILLDDEPEDDFSLIHTEAKQKLFLANDEVRTFFLHTTAALIFPSNAYTMFTQLRDYLSRPEVRQTEQMFSHLIQHHSSAGAGNS